MCQHRFLPSRHCFFYLLMIWKIVTHMMDEGHTPKPIIMLLFTSLTSYVVKRIEPIPSNWMLKTLVSGYWSPNPRPAGPVMGLFMVHLILKNKIWCWCTDNFLCGQYVKRDSSCSKSFVKILAFQPTSTSNYLHAKHHPCVSIGQIGK